MWWSQWKCLWLAKRLLENRNRIRRSVSLSLSECLSPLVWQLIYNYDEIIRPIDYVEDEEQQWEECTWHHIDLLWSGPHLTVWWHKHSLWLDFVGLGLSHCYHFRAVCLLLIEEKSLNILYEGNYDFSYFFLDNLVLCQMIDLHLQQFISRSFEANLGLKTWPVLFEWCPKRQQDIHSKICFAFKHLNQRCERKNR